METKEVPFEARQPGSKQAARRLRREGILPIVFYGPNTEPIPLQVDKKTLTTRVGSAGGSHLIRIQSDSPTLKDKVALIKEVQHHPVTGELIHMDLYEVDLTKKVTVRAPLRFVGKALGVTQGGILQPIVREIEIECLPTDIPDSIDVDVTELNIGNSLHLGDLSMPEGVEGVSEGDLTLVTVVAPTVIEAPKVEEAVPEAAEGAEGTAPAGEEKKEGESGS
ncbi:MAG: 50S ribosomal protein L25 [Candidatus Binatia bacterium]|nr:50S ribosomal protein L25 [Candidatus Binatia bacterium]